METRNEENKNIDRVSAKLRIRFRRNKDVPSSKASEIETDKGKESEDEYSKLITNTNILTALTGAFAAYETMDQKQFKHIVDAFTSSICN